MVFSAWTILSILGQGRGTNRRYSGFNRAVAKYWLYEYSAVRECPQMKKLPTHIYLGVWSILFGNPVM
jgi:hypothetical protein